MSRYLSKSLLLSLFVLLPILAAKTAEDVAGLSGDDVVLYCQQTDSEVVVVVGNSSGYFIARNFNDANGDASLSPPPAVNCSIKLVPEANQNYSIVLHVQQFDIAKDADCSMNFLKIFSSNDRDISDVPMLAGVFCGQGSVPVFIGEDEKSVLIQVQLVQPFRALKVKFFGKEIHRHWAPTGHRCDLATENRIRCAENPKICIPKSYKCDAFIDCPQGSDEENCPTKHDGDDLNSGCESARIQTGNNSGTVSSLYYPSNYTNNLRCQWHITTPPGTVIRLDFGFNQSMMTKTNTTPIFDIENGVDLMTPTDCPYDSLTIFSMENNTALDQLARFCGDEPPYPPIMFLQTNSISVKFVTDNLGTAAGFRLDWLAITVDPEKRSRALVSRACFGSKLAVIHDLEGVFNSPSFGVAEKHLDNKLCRWLIDPKIPGGKKVSHFHLRFNLPFDVPSTDVNCTGSYVALNKELRFCNEHQPPAHEGTIVVEAPNVDVELAAQAGSKVSVGFQLSFKAIVVEREMPNYTFPESLLPENATCGVAIGALKPAVWLKMDHRFYKSPRVRHAKPGRWRWQVQLVSDNGDDTAMKRRCGGAIISSNWILTSASCFIKIAGSKQKANNFLLVKNWTVIAGQHVTYEEEFSWNDKPIIKLDVAAIFVHVNYSASHGDKRNDIALVKLKNPIDFSDETTSPICLPSRNVEANRHCTVLGWSSEKESSIFQEGVLSEATMPVLDGNVCKSLNERYQLLVDPKSMLCLGHKYGRADPCQGFAGGPLACNLNGRWELHGIYSWSNGCPGIRTPGVFTRVFYFMNWITKVIQRSTNSSSTLKHTVSIN